MSFRSGILKLAVGAFLFAPSTLHAQFATDSFVTYDSSTLEVYGFTYTGLAWGGLYGLAAEAYLTDPNYYGLDYCEVGGSGLYVEADVSSSGPASTLGSYSVQGNHYYIDPGNYVFYFIASSLATTNVNVVPTGENNGGATELSGAYRGAVFSLSLSPSFALFSGSTIGESFSGFSDGCFAAFGGAQVGPPTPQSGTVNSSLGYSDQVGAPSAWISDYVGLLTVASGGCGWSVTQSVLFTPPGGGSTSTFAWNSLGQDVVPGHAYNSVDTYRGSASFTIYP